MTDTMSTTARRLAALLLIMATLPGAHAADPKTTQSAEQPRIVMTAGTSRFTVALDDTAAAAALAKMLPVTFEMSDLNRNEKKVRLPRALPTSFVRPGTIRAGDVMLWGDDTLVVFYETFESPYSYTRIGRIENPAGLARILGPGDVRISFSRP
ncbi:MAG: cyclophilin-like fold protein [Burkholderiaceae bacterium]|nr:cyclophilin-like fold protein [Burkholderiaceae bacterium]